MIPLIMAAILPVLLQEPVTIEVDVNLVNIFATVQGRGGRFVDDLTRTDFRILEDGVERPIEIFETEERMSTSFGILVDNSGSSSEVLRSVRSSLGDFVRRLPEEDEVFVMSFGTGVRVIHDIEDSRDRLSGALDRLRPFGTSVLFDALVGAIRKAGDSHNQRQVLIVLTDGTDNRSARSFSDVVRAAEQNMVMLYFIGIGPPILVDTYTLDGLASTTGGRRVLLREGDVGAALEEIGQDLERQYYLAYHASTDPGYHTIEVQVPGRDFEVRARQGYRVD